MTTETIFRFRPHERELLEKLAQRKQLTLSDTVRHSLFLLAEKEGVPFDRNARRIRKPPFRIEKAAL